MVSGSKTAVGLVILFVGLWASNFLSGIPVLGDLFGSIFGFLPAFPVALPDFIPGISTGLLLFLLGLVVTIWGAKSMY